MMKKTLFFLYLFLLMACGDKKEREIAEISVPFETIRFDQIFFHTKPEKFPELKNKYSHFFSQEVADSVWINKLSDTLQRELFTETQKKFQDFSSQEQNLKAVFQHIKYYFPKFTPPKVFTLISEVDYRSRVIYADSLLLIGLDNYLGENHHFYDGIAQYTRFEFQEKFLPTDVARAVSDIIVPRQRTLSFLDTMVYEGKKLYVSQLFLPKVSEQDILKYPNDKYLWAKENESEIWRYFVQNQLLYSTDKRTLSRFIDPAPFSKFYMELDSQSPGGIGKYIGLRIVQAYMKKYPDDFNKMLTLNGETLFKEANYKPEK